ncbi:hypothetical protein AB0A95_33375 [Micromonospora sp. NPDC049230]|uniref:hypothetical protein n=1 Tax=Micromonospora sp. NPDC049230 TaxID=3155502 RepID=UPI0033D17BAF
MAPPDLPKPPPGFGLDSDDEFVNVTPEGYTRVPRSSHRTGPHRLRQMLALGLLTIYLSNKTGWKIPNATELAKEWDEGEDRIRKAVSDLERAGFLVRFRAQNSRGRWKTRTFVSADPASLEPVRQYAVDLAAAYAEAKAAKGRETSGDDLFSQVGPDGGFRDSVDRDSVDRGSADRGSAGRQSVSGHLKNQKSNQGEQEEPKRRKKAGNQERGGLPRPPHPPRPQAPPSSGPGTESRESSSDQDRQPPQAVDRNSRPRARDNDQRATSVDEGSEVSAAGDQGQADEAAEITADASGGLDPQDGSLEPQEAAQAAAEGDLGDAPPTDGRTAARAAAARAARSRRHVVPRQSVRRPTPTKTTTT